MEFNKQQIKDVTSKTQRENLEIKVNLKQVSIRFKYFFLFLFYLVAYSSSYHKKAINAR